MSLSKEQLLIPRIKISEEGYPGMPFEAGGIYTLVPVTDGTFNLWASHTFGIRLEEKEWKRYPSIFRPLQWWQEREESDMPEYVKLTGPITHRVNMPSYMHVSMWEKAEIDYPTMIGQWFSYPDDYQAPYKGGARINAVHFVPATLEEYNAYKASQEVKP